MKNPDNDDPPQGPSVDTSEFFFEGSGLSALLVHGLTGTPYEMRFLGERLAGKGARVCGVKLAGHAGTPQELGATNHDNWYESVVDSFDRLLKFGDPVVVVGQSLGAVLAVRLAADQKEAVAGLALLSPAFLLTARATIGLRIAGAIPGVAGLVYLRVTQSDIYDATARRIHPTAPFMPIGAALNLLELSAAVRPKLKQVVQPTLIVHARQDHTAPIKNVKYVSARLRSPRQRSVILEKSYHVISVDAEKEQVADEVSNFLMPLKLSPLKAA